VSDARFGMYTSRMDKDERRKYFGAICFTETPISEIHSLLDIERRVVNLEPYGLVFLKDRCIARGVDPVIYINNSNGTKDKSIRALCSLIKKRPDAAAHLLPLVALFGQKLTPPGSVEVKGTVDFRWEREWRFVPAQGPFRFSSEDVFIGLCPHERIEEFEKLWHEVEFIDPTKNMKWYATKLLRARKRTDLKYSVV
jgi:hypothetical protein